MVGPGVSESRTVFPGGARVPGGARPDRAERWAYHVGRLSAFLPGSRVLCLESAGRGRWLNPADAAQRAGLAADGPAGSGPFKGSEDRTGTTGPARLLPTPPPRRSHVPYGP